MPPASCNSDNIFPAIYVELSIACIMPLSDNSSVLLQSYHISISSRYCHNIFPLLPFMFIKVTMIGGNKHFSIILKSDSHNSATIYRNNILIRPIWNITLIVFITSCIQYSSIALNSHRMFDTCSDCLIILMNCSLTFFCHTHAIFVVLELSKLI